MNINLFLQGISVNGPGFASWQELQNAIADNSLTMQETTIYPAVGLSTTERRRVTTTIKLALDVATKASAMANLNNEGIASIFASSKGDTQIMDYLGETLATPKRLISPTKFHNSLHNSTSGYWTIACNSHQQTQAIAAGEYTFVAGLVEAALYCQVEQKAVLFVVYDVKTPAALQSYMQIENSFAAAFVLSPQKTDGAIAELNLKLATTNTMSTMKNSELEKLRGNHPAAKCLPLLQALTENSAQPICIPYFADQVLQITCESEYDR